MLDDVTPPDELEVRVEVPAQWTDEEWERLGISEALSLDAHFAQFGKFTVVPLQTQTLPS